MTLRKPEQPDYIFLFAIGTLLVLGLASLVSASSVVSLKNYGDSYHKVKQQMLHGVIPGILLFFLFFKIKYDFLKKRMVIPLVMISTILMILVLIPSIGLSHGSARSWISLGGVSFQPSELMKLSFVLYLALWFSQRKKESITDFKTGFLPFGILSGFVVLLIIAQPDLGTAIVVALTSIAIYFLAGAKKSHIMLIFLIGLSLFFSFMNIAPDYQKNRLISFLNPHFDVQGISYHVNQAFLAIGSGGMLGLGFGESKQKFLYLPEVVGDSIFAIMAEELGFLFCFLFISLISFIAYRGFRIAKNAPDKFGYLTVVGIVCWFSIQSVVNIGAMVGLLPLTGVTLPLISYGGSSMVVFLIAFGIVSNISRYGK